MIQSDKTFEGYYNLQEGPMQRKPIRLDRVSNDSLEQMGRRLSGIKVNEIETTSEIPQSLDQCMECESWMTLWWKSVGRKTELITV